MNLFRSKRQRAFRRLRACIPFFLPACACLLFYLGISYAGQETILQEQSALLQALQQGAVHTYALTGSYPQSLEELLTDHKISYDPDKFVVEYVPIASNLFPSIDVIILANAQKGGFS